jgi:hypothetical protein
MPKVDKSDPETYLPQFSAAEKTLIKFKLLDGWQTADILKEVRKRLHPDDNYCPNPAQIRKFQNRVYALKKRVEKSKEYKELLREARSGVAKKDARIMVRKRQISSLMYMLNDYAGLSSDEMNDIQFDRCERLNNLLLKHLKDLAVELGEYKTTGPLIDMSDRRQQQLTVFSGQATVPRLEGDDKTGLRIVAPSVKELEQATSADEDVEKLKAKQRQN